MAVAAAEVQLTINEKVKLPNGRALYFGTAQGGTGYTTGGATLGEEATNSRWKMPERFDWIQVGASLPSILVSPNKLKLFAASATEAGEAELANAKTMATAIPAGTPFIALGLA